MRNLLLLLLALSFCHASKAQEKLGIDFTDKKNPKLGKIGSTNQFIVVNENDFETISIDNGLTISFRGEVPSDLVVNLIHQSREATLDLKDPAVGSITRDGQNKITQITYIPNTKIDALLIKLQSADFDEPVEFFRMGIKGHPTVTTDDINLSTMAASNISFSDSELGVSCNCTATHNIQYIEKYLKDNNCPDCETENLLIYDATCKSLFIKENGGIYRINDLKKVKFKYKKELKVYVINVNRFLKDIKVEAEDLVYESEAPSLFTNVFGSGSFITKLQ